VKNISVPEQKAESVQAHKAGWKWLVERKKNFYFSAPAFDFSNNKTGKRQTKLSDRVL
jgi:hypothetical protein